MITSTTNARIKEARKLHKRRYRQQTGRLLLEGITLIEDARQAGAELLQLFYLSGIEERNDSARRLLAAAEATGLQATPCTAPVMAALCTTVSPQGVVAVCPIPELDLKTPSTLILVLDAVRDPGNAGTLLRSAQASGVDLVLFAPETVDPFNDKVLRSAMGAHFRLPLRVCADWDQVEAQLGALPQVFVADAAAGQAYDMVNWCQPSVLVVGGEASGAGPRARSLANGLSIPMLGNVESLNAAMAGSVILFEAARQRRASAP